MSERRAVPPDLEPAIIERAGKGGSGDEIAKWLLAEHGIDVTGRTIRRFLKKSRAERSEITKTVLVDKLSKSVTSDLVALDGILERARADEEVAGRSEDVATEIERIATADILQAFDEKGSLLPLAKMPIEIRRAISSVETETVSRGGSGALDDPQILVVVTKVKFWDKTRSLEMLGKLRAALANKEVAIKARDQQLRTLDLKLKLSGAGEPAVPNVDALRAELAQALDELDDEEEEKS